MSQRSRSNPWFHQYGGRPSLNHWRDMLEIEMYRQWGHERPEKNAQNDQSARSDHQGRIEKTA